MTLSKYHDPPVPDGPAGCVLRCVEDLATDVARLRRRADLAGAYWPLERIAARVEVIDAALWPTAADLVREGWTVDDALAWADRRQRHVWDLLGGRPVV